MKEKPVKKSIFVLGMHRSGTSALMPGLRLVLGVQQNNREDHSAKDNPKGFFENTAIVALNDKILRSFDASWDRIGFSGTIDFSDSSFFSFYRIATEILKEDYANYNLWGLKDPRFSILLPFWEKVIRKIGLKPFRIIALRNPLEVAISQKIRYEQFSKIHICGRELYYTLNLWFWYNLRLLEDLPDDNNIVVSFDALLDDPASQMHRIGKLLGVHSDPDGLDEYVNSFLEKQLKHHNVNKSEVEPYLAEYGHVFEFYNRMKQFASRERLSKKDGRKLLEGMPDDRLLQSWASPIYGYIHTVKEKLSRTLQDIAAKESTIAEKDRSLAESALTISEKERMVTALESTISQNEIVIAEKNQLHTENTSKIADLQAKIDSQGQALSDAKDEIVEKDQALADANVALVEKERTITALEATISQKDNVILEKSQTIGCLKDANVQNETVIAQNGKSLEKANAGISDLQRAAAEKVRQIHAYREELYSVYASKSWRYTLLMRKVGTVIRRIHSVPHKPRLRGMIKRAYFLLPSFIRNTRCVDSLKNRFKQKETSGS